MEDAFPAGDIATNANPGLEPLYPGHLLIAALLESCGRTNTGSIPAICDVCVVIPSGLDAGLHGICG